MLIFLLLTSLRVKLLKYENHDLYARQISRRLHTCEGFPRRVRETISFQLFSSFRQKGEAHLRVRDHHNSQSIISNVILLASLAGTCTLILGRHLGFLKPDSSCMLTTKLAEALRVHFTAMRDAFYGLPFWKLLPTSSYRQLIKSEETIYKYVSCCGVANSWLAYN